MILSTDIPQLLAELKRQKFYGLLSLQFRDGEVTLIKREETLLVNKANSNSLGGTHRDRSNDR